MHMHMRTAHDALYVIRCTHPSHKMNGIHLNCMSRHCILFHLVLPMPHATYPSSLVTQQCHRPHCCLSGQHWPVGPVPARAACRAPSACNSTTYTWRARSSPHASFRAPDNSVLQQAQHSMPPHQGNIRDPRDHCYWCPRSRIATSTPSRGARWTPSLHRSLAAELAPSGPSACFWHTDEVCTPLLIFGTAALPHHP